MGKFNFGKDRQKVERKYNINKILIDEEYDYIIELINSLEGYLTRTTDDELTHQLLNPKLREDWVLLFGKLYYVCTTPIDYSEAETEYNKQTYLGLILRLKNIESRISDVSSKMTDTYQYLARLYGVGYHNNISHIVDRLVDAGYIDEEDKEEEKTERMELEENFINKSNIMLCHSLYAIEHEINGYISGCISNLNKVLKLDDKELKGLTISVIRDYCKSFHTPKFQTNLHHEAVKLMGGEKYTRVSQENWIDLLTNEDKIIELGKNRLALEEYQKSKAEDARFEFYGEDRCKILDESNDLMDIMLRVNYGLELFDLEGALDSYSLLTALNENNLFLFCEMFLRRNVMLGMIDPELKKKFERWMQGEEVRVDSASATTDNTHTEAEELCHLIHPKWWGDDKRKLEIHNEIKGLVSNYAVQDICNYLNEMRQQEKVLLTTGVQIAYDELQRMGMPTDKGGYDYKTFAKYYNK